jgi:primosomal protein N' (replication factor Y) (superfamily II helicase)
MSLSFKFCEYIRVSHQKESPDQRIGVILPVPVGQVYDYLVPSSLKACPGNIVTVEFGRQKLQGLVWHEEREADISVSKLKYISDVVPDISFSPENLRFLKWVASYTMAPLGAILKMMVSVPNIFTPLKRPRLQLSPLEDPDPDINFSKRVFNPQQKEAIAFIKNQISKGYSVTLLDGITGSGKTEVYLDVLSECLAKEQQALILLPQIALAPQIADRFEKRFGVSPTLWHSSLTQSQRRLSWKRICSGQAKVVIGARSSLFLPYAHLGMIVVDEEHDHAYKQEEGIIYQGRDLAVARAYLGQIPCILASATPSLETVYNCETGRYHRIRLESRYGVAQFPVVSLVDLRERTRQKEGKYWISTPLAIRLEETVAVGEQALIYLNRRGYAPLTLCRACGERLQCPYCSAWLVDHRKYGRFLCHYCGHGVNLATTCQKCGAEDALVACGPGVERIVEEIAARFPSFRTAMISSDTVEDADAMAHIAAKINNHDIDVIIGTQMIAKGHHFPDLTLVGVIDADLGLSGGDLRASEKTYQLLHQVAGRAGREQKPGHVYLQTYTPDHPVLASLISGDRDAFMSQEMEARKRGNMPPFARLASLIFSSFHRENVEATARAFMRCAPRAPDILVLGPAPAPLSIIRGKHRWRILLRTPRTLSIQSVIRHWMKQVKIPFSVKVKIDIDPYSFL